MCLHFPSLPFFSSFVLSLVLSPSPRSFFLLSSSALSRFCLVCFCHSFMCSAPFGSCPVKSSTIALMSLAQCRQLSFLHFFDCSSRASKSAHIRLLPWHEPPNFFGGGGSKKSNVRACTTLSRASVHLCSPYSKNTILRKPRASLTWRVRLDYLTQVKAHGLVAN